MKKIGLFLILGLFAQSSLANTVYSHQKIGDMTFTSAGGVTTISGPGGTTIIAQKTNKDQIQGTWNGGMKVPLDKILSGQFPTKFININDTDITMSDGKSFTLLAVTAEENDKGKVKESADVRAAKVCEITGSHPYLVDYDLDDLWFASSLMEVSTVEEAEGQSQTTFNLYNAPGKFSGAKYFGSIKCGRFPLEYQR